MRKLKVGTMIAANRVRPSSAKLDDDYDDDGGGGGDGGHSVPCVTRPFLPDSHHQTRADRLD